MLVKWACSFLKLKRQFDNTSRINNREVRDVRVFRYYHMKNKIHIMYNNKQQESDL